MKTKSWVLFLLALIIILPFAAIPLHNSQPSPLIVAIHPLAISQHATSSQSKIDFRIQSLMEKGNLDQEVEMIVTFQGVSSQKGAELIKSLGNITILETYSIISGALLKAPLGMATNIALQDYVKSLTYNYEVKLHSTLIPVTVATYSAKIDQIGATRLHNLGINGTGVKVAVLDTGINTHEALPSSKIIYSKSFIPGENATDLNGHGTHVAGIIAGYADDKYIGVAPGAQLLNIKVLNKNGEGTLDYLINGIQEAVNNGAQVISISAGALINNPNDPVCQAANNAVLKGIVVVAAAGNEGPDSGTINAPGEAALVICVGAVDSSNNIAVFSSRGPTPDNRVGVDLVAPGVKIVSLSYNDTSGYVEMSGTSQATPHVSGAVALLLSYNSSLTPFTIKAALLATAVDLNKSPYDQGCGLVNVSAAYDLLSRGAVPVAISPPRFELTVFGSQLQVTINFTLIGGLTSNNYLNNVRVKVDGSISNLITLSSTGPFDLNNTQKFVAATIFIPSYYMAPLFSGSIKLVNGNGEVIATAFIQGTGPTAFLLLFFLGQEESSFYTALALVTGAVIGVILIATVGLIIYLRRKKLPPEGFAPEPIDFEPFGGEPYRWPYY